ncbi:(Fe-S)-binding protein [Acidihalobacter yilgarnensis]|nr:(Fe-S)-binding protein [Acidihalobacter yilgarnensis]
MDTHQAYAAAHPERFAATDSCVQCGLCLPHCPTYLQTRQEGDSPRGRVSLIQALARGDLPADARLTEHLESCLVCRACEDMCPSRVPYASLLDAARAELLDRGARPPVRPLESWLLRQFTHSRRFRYLMRVCLRAWRHGGPWRLSRFTGIDRLMGAGRLHSLLPPMQKTTLVETDNPPNQDPDQSENAGEVQLFTGCASEVFDQETLISARQVLTRLGYRVHIPVAQTCCGALHLHAGDEAGAQTLARENQAAFRTDLPILSTASGCGATLKDSTAWCGEDSREMANATEDICAFLQRADWSRASLLPTTLRVAVHTPCSLKRVMHSDDAVTQTLARLPGIELLEVAHNGRCCGAAGRYMIDHPEMADALVADKVADLAKMAPDILVSSNVGCALHIRAALQRAGLSIEVVHPVNLIARRLAPLAASRPVA